MLDYLNDFYLTTHNMCMLQLDITPGVEVKNENA